MIQSQVVAAIADYIAWQTETIGVDINPSVLVEKIISAGAKRVEVISPAFTAIPPGTVARCISTQVTYGGLEDD